MAIYFERVSGSARETTVLTEDNFHQFITCPASLEDVLKLTGIIEIYSLHELEENPRCTVVLDNFFGAIRVNIETPAADMTRRINFKIQVINNDGLRVKKTGKDTGLYMFSGQRKAAMKGVSNPSIVTPMDLLA